jgi:protein gp37
MWRLIRATPGLDWLLLTKRPENIAGMLPALWGDGWPNVWLGVSAEDQARWDERVPVLLSVPAAVRFVSVEPMIGPVVPRPEHVRCAGAASCYGGRLARGERPETCCAPPCPPRIDLVIVGGESGPRHRDLKVEWVRALVAACRPADWPAGAPRPPLSTALFVKQDSGPRPGEQGRIPADLWIQEMPHV